MSMTWTSMMFESLFASPAAEYETIAWLNLVMQMRTEKAFIESLSTNILITFEIFSMADRIMNREGIEPYWGVVNEIG